MTLTTIREQHQQGADVHLRPVRLADWPTIHEWARRDDVTQYQAWGPNRAVETREYVVAAIEAAHQLPQVRHVLSVVQSDRVVGLAELTVIEAEGGVRREQGGEDEDDGCVSRDPRLCGRGPHLVAGHQATPSRVAQRLTGWVLPHSSAWSEKTCVSRQRRPSQTWCGMVCSSCIPSFSRTRADATFVVSHVAVTTLIPSSSNANCTA